MKGGNYYRIIHDSLDCIYLIKLEQIHQHTRNHATVMMKVFGIVSENKQLLVDTQITYTVVVVVDKMKAFGNFLHFLECGKTQIMLL